MDNRNLLPAEDKEEDIRLLVLDVDRCLLALYLMQADKTFRLNPRDDFLSQAVIDFAASAKIQAFTLCTHRNFPVLFRWLFTQGMYGNYADSKGDQFQPPNLLTHKVAEHFAAATGLACLAVSLPEDANPAIQAATPARCCGYAFEHVLKPYEIQLLEGNQQQFATRAPYHQYVNCLPAATPLNEYQPRFVQTSKNGQYIQLAALAAECYPHARRIRLFILDDIEMICKTALRIPARRLPANVTLVIMHHYEHEGIVLRPMGEVVGRGPAPFRTSTPQIYQQLRVETGGLVDEKALTPLPEETSSSVGSSNILFESSRSTLTSAEEPKTAEMQLVPDPEEEQRPDFPVSAPISIPGGLNPAG